MRVVYQINNKDEWFISVLIAVLIPVLIPVLIQVFVGFISLDRRSSAI